MYNIVYLSNQDRARLLELKNDLLPAATTTKQREKILEEIAEIDGRSKPLHQCTIEECTELKTFVFEKFQKVNSTGRYGQATMFKNMIQAIESRLRTIYIEMSRQEAEKEKQSKEETPDAPPKRSKRETSSNKTTARTGSSRWTTGIGNLD